MAGRTVLWLSTISGIIAIYLAVGFVAMEGPFGLLTWPFILFAWSALFRIFTFLGEGDVEIINDTNYNEGIPEQLTTDSTVPKDRRISSQEPHSGDVRATSRIIGKNAQWEPVHTKETSERSSYPGDPDGSRATRDFADFIRSS